MLMGTFESAGESGSDKSCNNNYSYSSFWRVDLEQFSASESNIIIVVEQFSQKQSRYSS